VCIGPLASEWLPVILGALDQLRNPSTWLVADDAAMYTTLRRVDQLREIIAVGEGCELQMMTRFTADCVLQTSVDGGTTWTDVPGWVDNFDSCVKAHIPPLLPPNPDDTLPNQHACNIAAFLATELIEVTMTKIVAYVGTTTEQATFATSVMQTLAFAFPITNAGVQAFGKFYTVVVGELLAEVEAVRDDPVFWSKVTCAIYLAIRSVGWVDDTNFAAVGDAIRAITYTYAWAPLQCGNLWDDLGLGNIRSIQSVGALNSADCTSCDGPWCHKYDFAVVDGSWTINGGTSATWVDGLGWEGAFLDPPGDTFLWLSAPVWTAAVVTHISLMVQQSFPADGSNESHTPHIGLFLAGANVWTQDLPLTIGGPIQLDYDVPSVTADSFSIYLIEEGNHLPQLLEWVKFNGEGNPGFGTLDCPS
jgi:hypothetical protein